MNGGGGVGTALLLGVSAAVAVGVGEAVLDRDLAAVLVGEAGPLIGALVLVERCGDAEGPGGGREDFAPVAVDGGAELEFGVHSHATTVSVVPASPTLPVRVVDITDPDDERVDAEPPQAPRHASHRRRSAGVDRLDPPQNLILRPILRYQAAVNRRGQLMRHYRCKPPPVIAPRRTAQPMRQFSRMRR